jgi:glucose/arabinose dehydrogenase
MASRRLLTVLAAAATAAVALVAGPVADLRAESQVRLVDAFPGVTFERPIFATQPPDGTPRLFVAEQGGKVWIVDHPAPEPPAVASKRLFLDLSEKVSRRGNEEGLLGFEFHPGYASNGRFLVHYSARYQTSAGRKNVLSEIRVEESDADLADPSTERVVLEVAQPYENHNGGWIGFDPEGFLLVALGDGGSGGDPGNRAQDLSTLLGKILRIDVDGVHPYAVPPDNPFVAREGARPEIFAYGLRNPWRCSVDRETGELWAGDVGQDSWEEVDRVVPGGNYGWRRREGAHPYQSDPSPPADPLRDPEAEYSHALGQSVTGGVVYRGTRVPSLAGSYLYADFVSGRIWTLADPYGSPASSLLLDTEEGIASFAEDRAGEVYVLSFGGQVLALRDGAPYMGDALPATLSELNLFRDLRRARPAAGALRYSVRAALWADGASKDRFLVLPDGASLGWRDTDAFVAPSGTYAVKTFARGGERLETRVIRRTDEGWEAATYRWRPDRSDADRVDARTESPAGDGVWTFPSPDDCRTCHTTAAGFLLGVNARQVPAGTTVRWSKAGALSGAPPAATLRAMDRNAVPFGSGRHDARARSYLDANCAFCHRPDDPTNASIDLRATTPLDETGCLDLPPQHGDLGAADARILAPGDPSRSTLLLRMKTTGEGRMPQLATTVPDRRAVRLLERWIRSLDR